MQSQIIAKTIEGILHSEDFPPKILKAADSLILQSSTTLPLKPNQEPARIHLCSVLACEKYQSQISSLIDTSKPPIPPAQYTKLLEQFRTALLPDLPRTPRKSRTARQKAAKFEPLEFDIDHDNNDEDEEFDGSKIEIEDSLNLRYEDTHLDSEDEGAVFTTPQKRRPPRSKQDLTPRKSPRKSPQKQNSPTTQAVQLFSTKAGLELDVCECIYKCYMQYKDMVKDPWALIYGITFIVCERVLPRTSFENQRTLKKAFGEVAHSVPSHEEWVQWTMQIVSGETWLANIAKKPEPLPHLYGTPGGWGQGVEF